MLRNLHDSLIDYDLTILRAVAQARGFDLSATRQAQAVDELKEDLLSQQATDWALSRLRDDSRAALEALLRSGGRMKAHLFTHRFGTIRAVGPGRLEREKPWMEPNTPAEQLWFLGWIFKTFVDVGRGYQAEFFYIPSDVIPLLPHVESETPSFDVERIVPPPLVRPDHTALIESVFAFLANLQMEPLSADGRGQLTPSAHGRLPGYFRIAIPSAPGGEAIPPEDANRPGFLFHLTRITELVHVVERRLRPNPPRVKRWLKWSRHHQALVFQQAWQTDPMWNELHHIPSLRLDETGWQNDPLLARQAVLDHLSHCPRETWLSVASFVVAIKATDPDFARPDGDYRSWYIRDAATGEYLMDFACWGQVEGALIVHLLSGPLHWLGAVSLDYAQAGAVQPIAFRVEPAAEGMWAKETLFTAENELAEEETAARLAVHPDFTVHFPVGGRLYERFQLHRVAQLKEDRGEEGMVYLITKSSLAAAYRQGINPRMVVSFLQRTSPEPLPENVLSALRRWRPAGQ